jgi:hypothetical protein
MQVTSTSTMFRRTIDQQFLSDPLYFDKNDYIYWKIHMRAFLKSLNYNVWISIEKRWTRPPDAYVDTWSKGDHNECNWNSEGLNAIFRAVSPDEFNEPRCVKSPRKLGKFYKSCTKINNMLKTQNFRCCLLNLKRWNARSFKDQDTTLIPTPPRKLHI